MRGPFCYNVAMQVTIPHKLTKEQAIAQVKNSLDEARPKMEGQATLNEERWEDNVLHFDVTAQGQRIAGTLAVEDQNFELNAKLPLMLRMFEGRIKKAIEEQTRQALGGAGAQ